MTDRDSQPTDNFDDDDISPLDVVEADLPTTTAADVESAGRSCLVILAMLAIILALLILWIAVGISGGSSS